VRGEAVDAGLREGRAVVPHQLVVLRQLQREIPRPKWCRLEAEVRRTGRIDKEDVILAYGLVGDDVPAGGEAHAGAVAERGGGGARGRAVAAQDAGPHRGQPPCHLRRSHSLSLALSLSDLRLRVWCSSSAAAETKQLVERGLGLD
jgi:hypothetical protein